MTNVVHLDRQIWVCGCDCITFEVMVTGRIECADCGTVQKEGAWVDRKALEPQRRDEVIERERVLRWNSGKSALENTLQKPTDEETAAVVVIERNGLVTTWVGLSDDDLADEGIREWLEDHLRTAFNVMVPKGDG